MGVYNRDHLGQAVVAGAGRLAAVLYLMWSLLRQRRARRPFSRRLTMAFRVSSSKLILVFWNKPSYLHRWTSLLVVWCCVIYVIAWGNTSYVMESFQYLVCNAAAHDLAQLRLSWDPDASCVWTNPFSEFVKNLVSRDVVQISDWIARP
jgi:hypothetical protein